MPMATASPCLSSPPLSSSSLWADQWPKSSGRDEPLSKGSPLWPICSRCSSAQRTIIRSIAAGAKPARLARSREEELEKGPVADQRHLDRLGDAGPQVPLRQRLQKGKVVDDGEGRRKGAEEILAAEGIDAVLDPDPGIVLGQHGGRQADQPDPAVGGGRGVTGGIQHRAAADGDDERMPAEPVPLDQRVNPLHLHRLMLADLPAPDDERRGDEIRAAAWRSSA